MLTRDKIEALLEINTNNKKDSRYLRIMSCDNPIKELYIYHLPKIKDEFNENPTGFDEQIVLCIFKFISDIHSYLDGKDVKINFKSCAVELSRPLLTNALKELFDLYHLINDVYEKDDYTFNELYQISTFRFPNYIAVLQLCGIIDINEDVYRSKLLARLLNIKDQVRNYRENRMTLDILKTEFSSHVDFLAEHVDRIREYDISEEDLPAYLIMFDVRHYKHNRKDKVLKLQ